MDVLCDERSDDEVYEGVVGAYRRLCVAQRDLLSEIVEHDRRQAWERFGATSEEAFLVAQFDVLRRTAKDWVKVAHALDRHHELAETLAAGEISFDQLAPLVEVMSIQEPGSTDPVGPFDDVRPDPAPEPVPDPDPASDPDPDPAAGGDDDDKAKDLDPLDLANRLSAGQLAGMARAMRRRSDREVAAAHRRRRCRTSDLDGGGGLHMDVDLFDEPAALLRTALMEYTRTLDPDPETGRYEPLEQSFADALAEFAAAWLEGRERTSHRPALIVHADARILAGGDGWAETEWGPLSAETARRIACYCHLLTCADDPAGDPLHLGRTRREPTWQLAETVRRRDGGCRFPGCRRRAWTNCHHIDWWDRDHGPTDYDNLCTLCRRHHRLVHEGGWRIVGDPRSELQFVSPTGLVLTSHPNQAGRPPDPPPPPDTDPARQEALLL